MMLKKALTYIKKMKFRLGKASFVIRKWPTNDEILPNLIR